VKTFNEKVKDAYQEMVKIYRKGQLLELCNKNKLSEEDDIP